MRTDGERGDGRSHSAFGERRAQPVNGALDSHVGGVLRQTQPRADFRQRQAFKVAQQHRLAVGGAQIVHGLIQQRAQFLPGRVGIGGLEDLVHFVGFLFVGTAALLRAGALAAR